MLSRKSEFLNSSEKTKNRSNKELRGGREWEREVEKGRESGREGERKCQQPFLSLSLSQFFTYSLCICVFVYLECVF
jgi:hypothetical protein